jgi:hypothetical protein
MGGGLTKGLAFEFLDAATMLAFLSKSLHWCYPPVTLSCSASRRSALVASVMCFSLWHVLS